MRATVTGRARHGPPPAVTRSGVSARDPAAPGDRTTLVRVPEVDRPVLVVDTATPAVTAAVVRVRPDCRRGAVRAGRGRCPPARRAARARGGGGAGGGRGPGRVAGGGGRRDSGPGRSPGCGSVWSPPRPSRTRCASPRTGCARWTGSARRCPGRVAGRAPTRGVGRSTGPRTPTAVRMAGPAVERPGGPRRRGSPELGVTAAAGPAPGSTPACSGCRSPVRTGRTRSRWPCWPRRGPRRRAGRPAHPALPAPPGRGRAGPAEGGDAGVTAVGRRS